MTYVQLVNSVLRRLREAEVSNVADTAYSKLIGDFVNEAKREVEDAWNWIQLRSTIQVTTVASTFRYTLTTAGDRFRMLQVVNDSQDFEMKKAPYDWMNTALTSNSSTTGTPSYWDINGQTSNDPNVDVWPIPDGVYTLNFNMVLPQDDLSSDDTELTVPDYPVMLLAYAKAISERGEDGATMYAEVMNNAHTALADAISIESRHIPHEMNWHVD